MKVSIAFDLSLNGTGSFFTLDDTTKGVLDNATYVLAVNIFTDLTSRVRSVQVKRGRSRQLQRFTAGAANIVFDNRDRGLDPLYSSSPYYGNIVPGKQIAIEHNGATLYTGTVADWNFDYTLSGDAVASVSCTDGLATIAQAVATAGTATAQLSGARINNYLSDAGWPAAQRAISAGQATLGADVIGTNTNSIGYLQKAADSDPGALFVGKTGLMTYKDRADLQAFNSNVTFGGATGIPFTDIKSNTASRSSTRSSTSTTGAAPPSPKSRHKTPPASPPTEKSPTPSTRFSDHPATPRFWPDSWRTSGGHPTTGSPA
jgi:hypothetical protein